MALPAIFSRLPASMTCCVFFAVINDAGDYSILSAYRACRDARRRVETGVSPTPKGGCGGHPPHIRAYTRNRFFAYQPQVTRRRKPPPMPFAHCRLPIRRHALLWCAAHSVTHYMCAPSFAPLRVSSLIRALRARYAREKSLPAIFSRLPARMTCCVFFAVINDAGDYSILSAYRACRDARRRVETGVSPAMRGVWGASPPHSRVHAQQILRIPATGYSAA